MSDSGAALPAVGLTAVASRPYGPLRANVANDSSPTVRGRIRGRRFFAQQIGEKCRAPRRRPSLAAWVVVRTRFLDDLVLDACARGCLQVVILGAGLDARAFRLDWRTIYGSSSSISHRSWTSSSRWCGPKGGTPPVSA